MTLTSDQIAKAIIRSSKKRGAEFRQNIPGEIRAWLESTPWFRVKYPTEDEQANLYWRVRTRILQRLAPKKRGANLKKPKGPLPKNDPRQKSFKL